MASERTKKILMRDNIPSLTTWKVPLKGPRRSMARVTAQLLSSWRPASPQQRRTLRSLCGQRGQATTDGFPHHLAGPSGIGCRRPVSARHDAVVSAKGFHPASLQTGGNVEENDGWSATASPGIHSTASVTSLARDSRVTGW